MPTKVVVGAQWGDEGKGKVIDILASRATMVVRSQGGNNAGHTVENESGVYKLKLIPSGILYPETKCLIGLGTVIDPQSILEEIDGLEARGISCDNLRIDVRAHVVMPWHIVLDGVSEDARGDGDIGTTRRGIGPCYMDKAERIGLRMSDLSYPETLSEKIHAVGKIKNRIITEIYGKPALDLDEITRQYLAYGERLRKYFDDVSALCYDAYKSGEEILFEGAQGTLLDLDAGTYPYVTSSNPISGGVCTGTGVGPTIIDEVIGVAKAYTTRVGKGPFPTELFCDIGNAIRDRGHEYGTNTGRPRRVGWFDAVILRHAVRVNGLTGIAINKFDILNNLDTLKVCVAYKKKDGTVLDKFPPTLEELAECEPVYKEVPGFTEDISDCKTYEELPENCRRYIELMEQECGCPVVMIGNGPARNQNIER